MKPNILSIGEPVRVVRVFLASPSDLREERTAARSAIDEINRTVARPAGFHVDLIGWEDTLSTARRPQAAINDDLSTCHMFIGILWGRWGTPPDVDGKYSSGFEEEFSLAAERHDKVGEPHMTLFFKDVDREKLADPGPELSRVLDFRQKVIDEKRLLFSDFPDAQAFAQKVRISVAEFINKLTDRDAIIEGNNTKQRSGANNQNAPTGNFSLESQNQESSFVIHFGEQLAQTSDIRLTSTEVSRLRNLSLCLGQDGNDDAVLAPHDCNIIYKNRSKLQLSQREIGGLAAAGLEAFGAENVPMWSWVVMKTRENELWLTYSTVIGPDRRKIGAFNFMTALRMPIVEDDLVNESKLQNLWFSDKISDEVKIAALRYIGEAGHSRLRLLAEGELSKNSYATRGIALETLVISIGRDSAAEAARYAISKSFDEISDKAAEVLSIGLGEFSDQELYSSLDHRSSSIRLTILKILLARGKLKPDDVRRFFGDPSIKIRRIAVQVFEAAELPLPLDELRSALVLKEAPKNWMGSSGYDTEGNLEFDKQRLQRLAKLTRDEIIKSTDNLFAVEDRFTAFAIGHFAEFKDEIRTNFDDRFKSFWTNYLKQISASGRVGESPDKVVSLINEHEQFRRRRLMRQAVDSIVRNGDAADLTRIRKALDEDEVDPSFQDIRYLERFGDKTDISRIAKISIDYRPFSSAPIFGYSNEGLNHASKAIRKLAGTEIAGVLSMGLPDVLLAKLIIGLPLTKFRKLGRPLTEALLSRSSDQLRKATALQILKAFSVKDIEKLLSRYLDGEKDRFYNVIFWLDLNVAFKRHIVMQIVQQEATKI